MIQKAYWWLGALLAAVGAYTLWSAERLQAASPPVVDVVGNLLLSDFNSYIGPVTTYKDWGNEPSIAVNPVDPTKIVISSFAYGTSGGTQPGASIWYSTNGGASWGLRAPVTSPVPGVVTVPRDWTFAYDSLGNLHAAVL